MKFWSSVVLCNDMMHGSSSQLLPASHLVAVSAEGGLSLHIVFVSRKENREYEEA